MYVINNNDFKILNKCKDFTSYLDNMLENVPRKDMYYKDRMKSCIYELLNYIFKSSYDDDKSLYKITDYLIEINKMVTKWMNGKIDAC